MTCDTCNTKLATIEDVAISRTTSEILCSDCGQKEALLEFYKSFQKNIRNERS
jgi:transcription elongation factor Elf1